LRVKVNDEEREVAEGTTLEALVGLLELRPERLAIERNRQVVRRVDWSQAVLEEGDRIEIVHFVGGGAQAG
jgi:thiazole synthase